MQHFPLGRRTAALRSIDQHDVRVLLQAIEHDLAAVVGDIEVFDDEVATEVRQPPLGPGFEIDEPEILPLDLSSQHNQPPELETYLPTVGRFRVGS
jgi:hypothetical protein